MIETRVDQLEANPGKDGIYISRKNMMNIINKLFLEDYVYSTVVRGYMKAMETGNKFEGSEAEIALRKLVTSTLEKAGISAEHGIPLTEVY